jgi:TetR/AcrR family fatty acid metabolism transcriptional regulator
MAARSAAGRVSAKARPASPRPVRESLREEARGTYREAIIGAAERVFARSGFYATRMADIAKEAGVGVGTLYNYFASKELIFSEILVTRHQEFQKRVEDGATASSPVERLGQLVRGALSCLDDHGALYAVLMERGGVAEWDVERLVGSKAASGYDEFLQLIDKTVRAAIRAKELRSDVEPSTLVAVLTGGLNGLVYSWMKRGRKGRLADTTKELMELYLQGAKNK